MSKVTEEYGETLITKDGAKPTEEVLAGKNFVGIYFSAHWCPPCRGFTPVLAEFYEQLREEGGHENELEIIFVSSDSDAASFEEYYREMPWTAIQFGSAKIAELGKKYGVRGIPTFIILDKNGEVVDRDGRSTVSQSRENTGKALSKWRKE